MNDQIDSMHKTQEEFNELSNKFSELSRELKKLVSEEVNKRKKKEIIDEITQWTNYQYIYICINKTILDI